MLAKHGLPTLPSKGDAVTAAQMERIEADVLAVLEDVTDVSDADDWRRKAKAIEAYLRSIEMQKPILGAQRHIEGRIGQLLGPPPGQGARMDLTSQHAEKFEIHPQIWAEYWIIARALNECDDMEYRAFRKSRRALVADIRVRLGLMPETPDLPEGKFAGLVVDPPWQQDTGPEGFNETGSKGHEALAYSQMSVEAIAALKDKGGKRVVDLSADDSHLYLWTINKYVEASYNIARAWGFKPSVLLTWCKKPKGVGLGDTFRLTTEFVLFCRRGSLTHRKIIPTTWFEWPRGKHSEKPDEFYKMVESVTPGPHVDLFARKKRKGWTVWGDEIGE